MEGASYLLRNLKLVRPFKEEALNTKQKVGIVLYSMWPYPSTEEES